MQLSFKIADHNRCHHTKRANVFIVKPF